MLLSDKMSTWGDEPTGYKTSILLYKMLDKIDQRKSKHIPARGCAVKWPYKCAGGPCGSHSINVM